MKQLTRIQGRFFVSFEDAKETSNMPTHTASNSKAEFNFEDGGGATHSTEISAEGRNPSAGLSRCGEASTCKQSFHNLVLAVFPASEDFILFL